MATNSLIHPPTNNWLQQANALLVQLEQWLNANWAQLAALFVLFLAIGTTIHIVLHKRDSRAAAAWVGLVWLVPAFGVVLYLLLGINRIQRRARILIGGELDTVKGWRAAAEPSHALPHWEGMRELITQLTRTPLTAGNDVEPMSPPEAMDAMLAAINAATDCIYLNTYIFGNDAAGKPFIDALAAAKQRGVAVYVLLDGFGSWYSLPPVTWRLKFAGVQVQRFLYSIAPWRMPYMNLRNHRKLLVIDRHLGFVGGMNLRAGYLRHPPRMNDIHFRVRGPVVGHFMHSFATDWQFVTGELLDDSYTGSAHLGNMLCRGISTGPDADFEKRRLVLLAAIGLAERSIRLVTPYFVPDQALQTALQLAALRGVQVDIVLPQKNNLPLVHWASLHLLSWLARDGCHIYLTPPPFDHSKLLTVDGQWSLIGSGNWDARSLRLNFEYDMECYDADLTTRINHQIDQRVSNANRLTLDALKQQHQLTRLRNALAHLLAPYL